MSSIFTRITLVISILMVLLFISPALAGAMNDEYIMEVSIDKNNIAFADHSGVADGNWIELSGGNAFAVPDPFTFTYNGINSKDAVIKGRNVSVDLNVAANSDHTITYPYDTHQMYVAKNGLNDVEFTFHGSDYFANKEVDVYLFNSSLVDLKHILNDIMDGKTASAQALYDNSQATEDVLLDTNGDISMAYTNMDAGSYAIVIILADDITEENILLSATAFEVLEYKADLKVKRNSKNLQLDITTEDAPDKTYTYGAILINEEAYTTNVRVEFDGTQKGFDTYINDVAIIDGFNLVGMALNDIDGTDVQNRLTDMFGSENITITYSSVTGNKATLYPDTTHLTNGDYLIFTGVTDGYNLVAFEQDDKHITSVGSNLSGNPGDVIHINDTKNGLRLSIGLNKTLTNGLVQIEKKNKQPKDVNPAVFDTPEGFVTFTPNSEIMNSMGYVNLYFEYEEKNLKGLIEEDLKIYWYDEQNGTWVPLEGPGNPSFCIDAGQDLNENYLWANVTHFSTYAIGGPAIEPGVSTRRGGGKSFGQAIIRDIFNTPEDPARDVGDLDTDDTAGEPRMDVNDDTTGDTTSGDIPTNEPANTTISNFFTTKLLGALAPLIILGIFLLARRRNN